MAKISSGNTTPHTNNREGYFECQGCSDCTALAIGVADVETLRNFLGTALLTTGAKIAIENQITKIELSEK